MMPSAPPAYEHTQRAPLCLLVYLTAAILLAVGATVQEPPFLRWLFLPMGLVVLGLAASFHSLTVVDRGDHLLVAFGPLPVFRLRIPYAEITGVQLGRTLLLDGWGIHGSIRGGWVWNLWGRACVVVSRCQGVIRIGSDDEINLARFLAQRTGARLEEREVPS